MSQGKEFEIDKQICMHVEDDRNRINGAVVPPIFQNTLFTYSTFSELADAEKTKNITMSMEEEPIQPLKSWKKN